MSDKMIVEMNNVYLTSSRKIDVFRDLSFSLKAGESAIIQGTAGSGKSSLIELMIGRQFAQSGSVEVFGHLLKRRRGIIKKIRKRIGGVGGIFSLVPSFTVSENICLPLVLSGTKRKVRKESLFKMLSEFSLLNQAGEYPANLTRVENMLVQYARASIANQPLLIIDEPLAGLDQKTYQRIYDNLQKMAISGQSLIILSSEPLANDFPNCRRLQILNGAIV